MNAHDDARTPGARRTTPSDRGLNSPDKVEKPLTDADLELVLGGLVELPDDPAGTFADAQSTEGARA